MKFLVALAAFGALCLSSVEALKVDHKWDYEEFCEDYFYQS
jgi:hypothetical protein